MNKKFITVIGLSGALLVGSVYSISANTSGYELYKDALKKTHQLNSTTMNMDLDFADNGKEIFSIDSVIKTGRLGETMGATSTISNGVESSTYEMAKKDDQYFVQKDNENKAYTMTTSRNNHEAITKESVELKDDLENLVDVLTKNLQQKMMVNLNKDGSQLVELELSSSEVPLAVNAVTSLMFKHAVMLEDRAPESKTQFHNVKPELPNLKEDILITDVKVSAKISKNHFVENQQISATVTGKDEAGKAHNLNLSFSLDLTNANKTTVSPMDVSGLTIEEFQHSK